MAVRLRRSSEDHSLVLVHMNRGLQLKGRELAADTSQPLEVGRPLAPLDMEAKQLFVEGVSSNWTIYFGLVEIQASLAHIYVVPDDS